ncbi:hypothetical protein [Tateyamaria sp. syn59]|uniref:hypothetical protein n=1 Tax=Tateyamaria sp. syn59 TaxID=2576942 RepID=UPI0011BF894A|nr:hypothetical protein [Tateyamaria sp. syn59]
MDQDQRLSTLVFKASNLRDYLMHVQGANSAPLAQALRPFDRTDEYATISDKDVLALRNAFEQAYDELCLRIDTYTIGEVLVGQSPVERGTPIMSSLLLCFAGLLLVAAVFNFTYWANRATVAVAEAQEFLAFDHASEIARLIEMKIYFDTVVADNDSNNLEPQLMYLEGISTLQQHYSREAELVSRMHVLWEEARAYRAPGEYVNRWVCEKTADRAFMRTVVSAVFVCPAVTENAVEAQLSPQPALSGGEGDDDVLVDAEKAASVFDQRFMMVKSAQFDTMRTANRSAVSFYQDTLDAVNVRIKDLRDGLNTIHLWALPIFYGMLGSVVYCMWRVLNPSVAALGFFYSFMRTIFAGLAAMTLSMLLVPSNILTAGVELNRPLIYLLSFVFGYSVEVFINTLNMFNTYFLANLTTRGRKDAK